MEIPCEMFSFTMYGAIVIDTHTDTDTDIDIYTCRLRAHRMDFEEAQFNDFHGVLYVRMQSSRANSSIITHHI